MSKPSQQPITEDADSTLFSKEVLVLNEHKDAIMSSEVWFQKNKQPESHPHLA